MRSGLHLNAGHTTVLHRYLLEQLGSTQAAQEATLVFVLDTAVAAAVPADALSAALPLLQRLAAGARQPDAAAASSSTPSSIGATTLTRLLDLFSAPALEGLPTADRAAAEACLVDAATMGSGLGSSSDTTHPPHATAIRAAALAAMTPELFAALNAEHRADAFRVRAVYCPPQLILRQAPYMTAMRSCGITAAYLHPAPRFGAKHSCTRTHLHPKDNLIAADGIDNAPLPTT